MKRVLFSFLAATVLAGLVGCQSGRLACIFGSCRDVPRVCDPCRNPCPRDPGCHARAYDPVPPSGAVTYPYYTTRGPRDFLAKAPRSIGP